MKQQRADQITQQRINEFYPPDTYCSYLKRHASTDEVSASPFKTPSKSSKQHSNCKSSLPRSSPYTSTTRSSLLSNSRTSSRPGLINSSNRSRQTEIDRLVGPMSLRESMLITMSKISQLDKKLTLTTSYKSRSKFTND